MQYDRTTIHLLLSDLHPMIMFGIDFRESWFCFACVID